MDKIICVGKNYLKHAVELGDAINEEPLYFLKPPSTLFLAQEHTMNIVTLPAQGEVHHELELVFQIGESRGQWMFTHFTLGLDLTLRELQASLKKAGQPWEKAKVFKNSAILGPWIELTPGGTALEAVLNMPFSLKINGSLKQNGLGKDMRWKPSALLSDIQRWFPVCAGDTLFTGTPEGVGPIRAGDVLQVTGGPIDYQLTFQQ